MSDVVIEKCATRAIAEQRAGFWHKEGFSFEILVGCTVTRAEASSGTDVTGNAAVFRDAPFIVIAWGA